MPFTHEQFLDVFAAYHRRLWPGDLALWLITVGAVIHLWRTGPPASRLVAVVLTLHWAWSAIAYHFAFFWQVNPAAPVFGTLFLVQSALFLWRGVFRDRLTFAPSRSAWGVLGAILVVYALVYPGLGLLSGLSYPRTPTFGLPCPTTLLTAGLLLWVPRPQLRRVVAIPVLWAAIGGSAAFLLRIPADLALLVAGALLLLRLRGS